MAPRGWVLSPILALSFGLTVLAFSTVGVLTVVGSGTFDTVTNTAIVGALAGIISVACLRPTWSSLLSPTLVGANSSLTPTQARFEVLLLVWLNILPLALFNLFALCIHSAATTPPIPSSEPLIFVFLECIYTTVFIASGIGYGAFMDNHWSTMTISFLTVVYLSMILRPIVFAKWYNLTTQSAPVAPSVTNRKVSVDTMPLLKLGHTHL